MTTTLRPGQTLPEFLATRLDDDERVARAAMGGGEADGMWTTNPCGRPHPRGAFVGDFTGEFTADFATYLSSVKDCNSDARPRLTVRGTNGMVIYDEGGHDQADADHIARWNPARVMAEVKAKRIILGNHNAWDVINPPENPTWIDRHCVGCGATYQEEAMVEDINDCPVLRALARPYADHPDYRPEWATDPAETD